MDSARAGVVLVLPWWLRSSSLCSRSDMLLRSWSACSGGSTDSVLRRRGVTVFGLWRALTSC